MLVRHCEASHLFYVIARRIATLSVIARRFPSLRGARKEFRNEKSFMRRGNLTIFRHCEAHQKTSKMKKNAMRRGNLTIPRIMRLPRNPAKIPGIPRNDAQLFLRLCEASHNSFVIARRTKEFINEKNVMLVYVIARRTNRI